MDDLNKLKAAALAATNSEWFLQPNTDAYTHIIRAKLNPNLVLASTAQSSSGQARADAVFIAAANPAAVLSLIATIEQLQARVKEQDELINYFRDATIDTATLERQKKHIAELEARIAELEPTQCDCKTNISASGAKSTYCSSQQMMASIADMQRGEPVSGVVLRDGQPTLLADKHIKTTDKRLYAEPVRPAIESVSQVRLSDSEVDVDALANFIRRINGANNMGAGALAESICGWICEHGAAAGAKDSEDAQDAARYRFLLDLLLSRGVIHQYENGTWVLRGIYGVDDSGLRGAGTSPKQAVDNAILASKAMQSQKGAQQG